MPTPGEKKALLFFGAVALLGIGARVERSRRPPPPPTAAQRAALQRQIAKVDSFTRSGGRRTRAKTRPESAVAVPQSRITLIDLDRATAAEIEALPRIGPALAARIVADRDSLGPFGSIAGLERVRGIGPSMARELTPHVTFTLSARPRPPERKRPPAERRSRKSAWVAPGWALGERG